MNILTLSGSLRSASKNSALLRAAPPLAPDGIVFSSASIRLPLYDDDLQDEEALRPVVELREAVTRADAVLIATPEYNYGIPGPLKNALDWASRPAYQSSFRNKPVGIVGAAGGVVGTARAQGQLKQVLLGMACQVFPYPEFLVGTAAQKFDEAGALTDETTREFYRKFLAAFASWAEKVK